MTPDLTDEETASLTRELHDIIESDRYQFSPRIRTMRNILAKAQTGAGPRGTATAESVCTAASRAGQKATRRPLT